VRADCGEFVIGLISGTCKRCWDKRRYRSQRKRILELNRAWREANPDYWRKPEFHERTRRWLREHPEAAKSHVRAAKRRRRARAAGRTVEEVQDTEAYIRVLGADPCAYCGGPADTLDHIDALAAGGNHVWDKLTAACRVCNSAKHTASLLTLLLRRYRPQTGHGEEPCCA
jgi:hypothetical protein